MQIQARVRRNRFPQPGQALEVLLKRRLKLLVTGDFLGCAVFFGFKYDHCEVVKHSTD